MEVGRVYYQIRYESKTAPFLVAARLQRHTNNGWCTWSSLTGPADNNWKEAGGIGWHDSLGSAIGMALHMAIYNASRDGLSLEEFVEIFDRLREIDEASNLLPKKRNNNGNDGN